MGNVLYVLIGAVVGGGCVWLVYDIKAKRIIDGLRKRLGIAEAENLRIRPLEQQIAETKAQNAELQERIAELKEDIVQKADTIAALNVQLVEQAQAARDKLSMLNEVQGRFCQAMAALSETALNCDNEEFIRVMEVNVTSFEKTLLQDFEKWQSHDKAVTREVCDLADSEQAQRPLFVQDRVMEGLVAADAPMADEPAESIADLESEDEEIAMELETPEGPGAEVTDVVEDVDAQEEPAAEGDEAEEMDGAIDAALVEDGTADAVADLEKELEEELALELDVSEDDEDLKLDLDDEAGAGEGVQGETGPIGLADESSRAEDTGEIRLADEEESDSAPSLKFPILEVPAANVGTEGAVAAAEDDAGKKKLNSESGSLGARKEAV